MAWIQHHAADVPKSPLASGFGGVWRVWAAVWARLWQEQELSAPELADWPSGRGAPCAKALPPAAPAVPLRADTPAVRRAFSPIVSDAPVAQAKASALAQTALPARGAPPLMHALAGETIVVTTMGGKALRPCLGHLSAHLAGVIRAQGFTPDDPLWTAPHRSYLLVDLDAMGGIARIAPDLMALRRDRPDLIVLLLSAEFERHDYGQERLALCDVSLRQPCTFAALELALLEGEINNWAWHERLFPSAHV